MKYLIYSPWGLGDLVMITPGLFFLNKKIIKQKNASISIVVKSNFEKEYIKKIFRNRIKVINFQNLLNETFILKLFGFVYNYFKYKFYSFDKIIIPSFFSKKSFFIFNFFNFFFKYSISYNRLNNHRVINFNDQIEKIFNCKINISNEINQIRKKLKHKNKNKNKIVIFPGSDSLSSWKRYNILNFIQLEKKLRKLNYDTIFLIGPEELNLKNYLKNTKIEESNNYQKLDKILSDANYLITSDTGIAHYSSLLFNTNIISIFGPSDPEFTRPLFSKVSVINTKKILNCMPCINTKLWGNCDKELKCLASITPLAILNEIKKNGKNN